MPLQMSTALPALAKYVPASSLVLENSIVALLQTDNSLTPLLWGRQSLALPAWNSLLLLPLWRKGVVHVACES